jgi:hypothetical protein
MKEYTQQNSKVEYLSHLFQIYQEVKNNTAKLTSTHDYLFSSIIDKIYTCRLD